MVYRQNLRQYERSDPQGYDNWGSTVSTPNHQTNQQRQYQTPIDDRQPLSNTNGREGQIYNSFLPSHDHQPEKSRSDPPSSSERNRKVNFSSRLEVHGKQTTPAHATPATPILRTTARSTTSLAPTPSSVRQSPHQSSSRDPTPRAGYRTMTPNQSGKRKTIHDILSERTNAGSAPDIPREPPASDPAHRSRRPQDSRSVSSPRDIFSKMALRSTQSEVKAPKQVTETEATETLLSQARFSRRGDKSTGSTWDISELFPSTPHGDKKRSDMHHNKRQSNAPPKPLSMEELLSQPPPPPLPLPSDPQKSKKSHLKAYESREDHWDSADLYSDSWNRHLKDKSPSNASTESQDARLITRYQLKSTDRSHLFPQSASSDIDTFFLRQEEVETKARQEPQSTKSIGAVIVDKPRRGYLRPHGVHDEEDDDQDGTEVILLQGPERAEGIGRGQESRAGGKGRRRKAKTTDAGTKLNLGTRLKCSSPRSSKSQPANITFHHFPAAGISFEESPDLNKDDIETSEVDFSDEFKVRRSFSRELDGESNVSPVSYGRLKRERKCRWMMFCIVIIGLVLGLCLYYFVFDDTETRTTGATTAATTAASFDACVEATPDQELYSSRYANMRKIIKVTINGRGTQVDEPGSSQRKALCWISDFDTQIDSFDGSDIPAVVQRYTMAVLYYTLVQDGAKSEKSLSESDYLSSSHECDWSVVMCASPNTVTSLLLADKHLAGQLPVEIGNLVNLSFLDFSLNALTGDIPSSINKLTHLEYLSLAFTSFSGTIPTEIGMLSKLEFLNMRSSQVNGKIPTELGGLSNLETLLLDGNWLSGTIPEHLGNLGMAHQMSLGKNFLTGRVPSGLCELRDNSLAELQVDSWIECECCTT